MDLIRYCVLEMMHLKLEQKHFLKVMVSTQGNSLRENFKVRMIDFCTA